MRVDLVVTDTECYFDSDSFCGGEIANNNFDRYDLVALRSRGSVHTKRQSNDFCGVI